MSPLNLKGIDISIALLLLLSSAIFTTYAYLHILSLKSDSTLSLGVIADGVSRFNVVSDGKCVGYIEVLQEHEETLRLRGEGKLRVVWQGGVNQLTFSAETFFNPLGQLVRSAMEVSMGDAGFLVSTADVHPIQTTVSVRGPGPRIEQKLQLPGPVVLKKNKNSEYGIDYPALRDLLGQAPGDVRPESFNLSVEPVIATLPCTSDAAFDLTSLAAKVLLFSRGKQFFEGRP